MVKSFFFWDGKKREEGRESKKKRKSAIQEIYVDMEFFSSFLALHDGEHSFSLCVHEILIANTRTLLG